MDCFDGWLAVRTHVFIRWRFASANQPSTQIKIPAYAGIFILNFNTKKIIKNKKLSTLC